MSYTRLYRSADNKVIGGICGGLGEYFNIDPNLVRVGAVLLVLATHGFAFLAYLVGWIIIPRRPLEAETTERPPEHQHAAWAGYLPGLILILVGAMLLVREHWFWFDFHQWWPVLLILVGLVLVFHRRKHRKTADANEAIHRDSEIRNGGTVS